MSGKERDTFSSFVDFWTEANQKILREVADFSINAAAEGLRVAGEVQAALTQSAGRLQDSARETSGKIREEVSNAMTETQRLSSPPRG